MSVQQQAQPAPQRVSKEQALQNAQKQLQAGRQDEAQRIYQQLADRFPDSAEAWDGLGLIAHQRKQMRVAREHFEKAIKLNPKSATYQMRMGVICRALGDPGTAVKYYQRAAELDPNLPGLYGNMGNSLRDTKRYKEAVVAYRKAAASNPGSAMAMVNLALGLGSDKQYAEAAKYLKKALEVEPDNANTHKELGNMLLEQQLYDEALANYRKAIELTPDDHTAYHNLATALQNIGRLEEAADAYRDALKIQPDFFGSLRQFASVKKFREGDEEIAVIEEGLKSENLNDEERIDLYFAVAKAYDDSGQYDKAFRQLQSANQLFRKTLDYHPDKNRQFVDRILSTYDKRFYEARADFGHPSKRPIFIVGMPRSGTTLTEQIIASHPQVYGAGELMRMHQITSGISKRYDTKVNYPEAMRLLDKANVLELAEDYLSHLNEFDSVAAQVTDKMPFNYRMLGFLMLLFPNAKVIHTKRDPLDTCLSCYFVKFKEALSFSYNLVELGHYYQDYLRLMEHWRQVLPQSWLEVQYEELVANQEAESRRLIEHCGLEWDENCLQFHKTDRPILTASSWQVRQPMYKTSAGRWQRYDKYLGPLKQILENPPSTAAEKTEKPD